MIELNNGDMPATPIRGADNTIFTASDAGAIEGLGLLVGLTKREHLAGLAMQGILSHSFGKGSTEELAEVSLECADALLKALKEK